MPEKQGIENIVKHIDVNSSHSLIINASFDCSQIVSSNNVTRLEKYEYKSSPMIFQPIKSYEYVYNEIEFNKCLINTHKLDCADKTISINELGNFLKENLQINELRLNNCGLNVYKIDQLLHAYGTSLINLTSLCLSNNINLYFGVSLMTNFFVNTTHLENYALGTKLNILQLNNCQIDEYVYKHLLEKLNMAYPNLIQLDLSNNQISDDAVFHTLRYISDASLLKLQLLDLSDNLAKEDTICSLQKLIVYNGYQCALSKNVSSNDLTNMFYDMFNKNTISASGDIHNVEE